MTHVHRVCVVSPNWVGDAVMAQVLIQALHKKHGACHIDVLAPLSCHDVWHRIAGVHQVLDGSFQRGVLRLKDRYILAKQLRGQYDQAIVLPNSLKSALIPWLAHIPHRTGYRGECRWKLLNDCRVLDKKRYPRWVDRCYALAWEGEELERCHLDAAFLVPILTPNLDNQQQVLARLGLEVSENVPIAMLCTGAEYGSAKQWPIHHWQALAVRLVAEGYQVWAMGSPKEKADAEYIQQAVPELKVLCGQTSLGDAIDLMALASKVIANDSGLLHIAAALGRSVIGLYGSTPSEYAPPIQRWEGQARAMEIALPCRPCRKRVCPLGHRACLEGISPESVSETLRAMKPIPILSDVY
jgi:heptosyltransferase II